MEYIIEFDVIALVFLLILAGTLLFSKRIRTWQNYTFTLLLVIAIFTLVFDIAGGVVINYPEDYSLFTLYFINICYYVSQSLLGLVMLLYIFIITGTLLRTKLPIIILAFIPGVFLLLCSLLTPVNHLIFYITEQKEYVYGSLFFMTYAVLGYELIIAFLFLLIKRKQYATGKLIAFIAYFLTAIICAVIQYYKPEFLLLHVSTAIGIVIFYLSMQSPTYHLDILTGTFNSSALDEMLDYSIKAKKNFAVVALSFGNYSNINATYGVEAGNQILILVAKYLMKAYGNYNVIRYRGTHFAFVLKNTALSYNDLQEIKNKFPKKWYYNNIVIPISLKMAAINSSCYTKNENSLLLFDQYLDDPNLEYDGDALLIDEYYIKEMDYTIQVQNALSMAIETRSIDIHIQPIVDVKTGKVIYGEVLARLSHPTLGHVSPAVFIPISEQSGLINNLGYLIFEKACIFLSTHDIRKYGLKKLEVNLSVTQCMQTNISEKLMKTLKKYNLTPDLISFEITETAASTSLSTLNETMKTLIDLGFTFSLDDFGTGYSNLSYIMRLPFENIKLDKDLLWSCFKDQKTSYLFESICNVVNSIGLKVICEGVENETHVNFLKEKNVNYIQGFYFSKPIPTDEFFEYIKKNNTEKE